MKCASVIVDDFFDCGNVFAVCLLSLGFESPISSSLSLVRSLDSYNCKCTLWKPASDHPSSPVLVIFFHAHSPASSVTAGLRQNKNHCRSQSSPSSKQLPLQVSCFRLCRGLFSTTVLFGLADTGLEQDLLQRATASQDLKKAPTDEFARKVVARMTAKSPHAHFVYGYSSLRLYYGFLVQGFPFGKVPNYKLDKKRVAQVTAKKDD